MAQNDTNTNSYAASIHCASRFIKSFMSNCSNKNKENDYRPILQNLVQDLLTTLNQPEWPASSVILQILSRYLAQNVSSSDISDVLRTLSIQLLGLICARIRLDMKSSQTTKIFETPEIHVSRILLPSSLTRFFRICKMRTTRKILLAFVVLVGEIGSC